MKISPQTRQKWFSRTARVRTMLDLSRSPLAREVGEEPFTQ
jgi:hypothetical protein